MLYLFMLLLSIFFSFGEVQAENNVNVDFEGWRNKQLHLISLLLPTNPVILETRNCPEETTKLSERWPESSIITFKSWLLGSYPKHIDLICLDLEDFDSEILKCGADILNNSTCLYISAPFVSVDYSEFKLYLEQLGYTFFVNWYDNSGKGKAIFIKKDYFYSKEIESFLKNNQLNKLTYQTYYEPYFKAYYDLENEHGEDSIKNILKQGYPYEGNIGIMIDRLIKPESIAIDVGAHIGIHTITMSRKTGPQGAVIAFEPNKKLYMELLNNLSLNNCKNVISISKGLGDTTKKAFLNNFKIDDNNQRGESIEIMELDSLHLNNVSLIKMDIENYEFYALKGAQQTILRNRPVIIFECWIGANYEKSEPKEKANFDCVMALMESYGYHVHVIYCNDFIAFPAESTDPYQLNFKRLDFNNFDIGLNG